MIRGLSWRNFDFLLLGAIVLATAFGADAVCNIEKTDAKQRLEVVRQYSAARRSSAVRLVSISVVPRRGGR